MKDDKWTLTLSITIGVNILVARISKWMGELLEEIAELYSEHSQQLKSMRPKKNKLAPSQGASLARIGSHL